MTKKLVLISIFFFHNVAFAGEKMAVTEVHANKANLYNTVKKLTEITPARSYENFDSLMEAAELIKECFRAYGYGPEEQPCRIGKDPYKNIIAAYGPASAPRVIIGAHYDVCGPQPGADDNASAVAGLLEIARLIKEYKPVLKYRIDFVAFTLEEPPFFRTPQMGSYVHAKSLIDNQTEVIGMICLEMIGYYSDLPGSQQYPSPLMKLFYPSRGNFIGIVGKFGDFNLIRHMKKYMQQTSIAVQSLVAPTFLTGVDFSDHLNYWKFGYQAVLITDTAFYRNPNYHKPTDNIGTLNFDKMKEAVEGVYWALINFDDSKYVEF